MKEKEKTLHVNLLKKYIVRENSLIGNVEPAVQDDHRQNIPSGVAVVEDYEPDATVQLFVAVGTRTNTLLPWNRRTFVLLRPIPHRHHALFHKLFCQTLTRPSLALH